MVALLAIITVLSITMPQDAQAQTFSVLHYFTGGLDGDNPYAGVTLGRSGVLYGTGANGGNYGAGTVFKLSQVIRLGFRSFVRIYRGQRWILPIGRSGDRPEWCFVWHDLWQGWRKLWNSVPTNIPATFCRGGSCDWNVSYFTLTGLHGSSPQN